MKRRFLSILLAAVMPASLLIGCGSSTGTDTATTDMTAAAATSAQATTEQASTEASSSGTTTTEEKTGKGITIRLMTRMSGEDASTEVIDEVKNAMMEKYPDLTIEDDSVNDSNAFDDTFKTDIASGNVADIIQWPGTGIMHDYAQQGVFLDLTDLINGDEDIKNNVDSSLVSMYDLSSVGVDGIYALPIVNQYEVFYYRKDLFEKAGITNTPTTWEEFRDDCDKLSAIGVIPWSVGASNAWRLVHIDTGLIYKTCGVQKALDLASGSAKWTDDDIVNTISYIKELGDSGVFGDDYTGIDYETEKQRFLDGETAITFDGSWRINTIGDIEDNVGTFTMPYFEGNDQYANNDISYPSQLELSGALKDDPEKLSYVWEMASMFDSKQIQEDMLYKTAQAPVRTDIEVDSSKVDPILAELLQRAQSGNITWGTDAWAYDTNASLENYVGDALVGAVTGMTAEDSAKQIQDELDQDKAE